MFLLFELVDWQIDNVSKVYETKKSMIRALQPISLKIKPCSKVVFLGPSGSGASKTQFLFHSSQSLRQNNVATVNFRLRDPDDWTDSIRR